MMSTNTPAVAARANHRVRSPDVQSTDMPGGAIPTDGVSEATTADERLFTVERIGDTLTQMALTPTASSITTA